MKNIKAVVFDLDGTLCESYDPRPSEYWTERKKQEMVRKLYDMLKSGYRIIILTWRKSKEYRRDTLDWLNSNYILYDRLYMQEWSIASPGHIFKKEILQQLKKEYYIVNVYDDDLQVGNICEELGIHFTLSE